MRHAVWRLSGRLPYGGRMITDRPNTIPWPPLLYLAGAILPWLLHKAVPLDLPSFGRIADLAIPPTGWAFVAAGAFLAYLGVRSLRDAGTAVDPRAPADKLVTFGPFNQSRNPIYLGVIVAFFGLAIATGNLWRFAAIPVLVVALTRLAIEREEQHLAARFGAQWQDYATKVRRWM
jgi:protein-S-isoprenylcysteine O-methyltransferase Ste14